MTAQTITAPVATPIETVTPIKPSEALRLGRVLYPVEVRWELFGNEPGTACAIGALLAGYGHRPTDEDVMEYPYVVAAGHVHDSEGSFPVTNGIWQRNDGSFDGSRWNTDEIATWLEGLGL